MLSVSLKLAFVVSVGASAPDAASVPFTRASTGRAGAAGFPGAGFAPFFTGAGFCAISCCCSSSGLKSMNFAFRS